MSPYRTKHPLYVIPAEHDEVLGVFRNGDPYELSWYANNGDLYVYASSHGPEMEFFVEDPYGDEGEIVHLADFMPKYTPTSEEVVRALRGPQGDVGPMGPAGQTGAAS